MIAVRRAIIFVAQILALISIVVSTMAGALAGDWLANTVPALGGAMAILADTSWLTWRSVDSWRCRRLLHFDNAGGAIFFVRRNRSQHEKSVQYLL